MSDDAPRRPRKPKPPNPPHVRRYRATCPACGRVYEGNFPMWVEIGDFPCICGARVPAPLVFPATYREIED